MVKGVEKEAEVPMPSSPGPKLLAFPAILVVVQDIMCTMKGWEWGNLLSRAFSRRETGASEESLLQQRHNQNTPFFKEILVV